MKCLLNWHTEIFGLLLCSVERARHLAVIEVGEQVPADPEAHSSLRALPHTWLEGHGEGTGG